MLDKQYLETMTRRAYKRYVVNKPNSWREFPQTIQLDLNNHCGVPYCGVQCSYCHPQAMIAQGKREFAEMPMDHIKWVFKEIKRDGKLLRTLQFFLNGDITKEPRLPEIARLSKQINPNLSTGGFTNGIDTAALNILLDRNIDAVNFTISGHNREMYRRMHGGDHFDDAMLTLKWFCDRLPLDKRFEVHCVVSKTNFGYMADWWKTFDFIEAYGGKRVFSPLVASVSNITSIKQAEGLPLDVVQKRIDEVTGNTGSFWTRYNGKSVCLDPCELFHNSAISLVKMPGKKQKSVFCQCCNWGDETLWNYGDIDGFIEQGLQFKRDYWLPRVQNKLNNSICDSCNMKHPDWKNRLTQF